MLILLAAAQAGGVHGDPAVTVDHANPSAFVHAMCSSPRPLIGTVVSTKVGHVSKDRAAVFTDVTFRVLADPKESNGSAATVRWPGGKAATSDFLPRVGETWVVPLFEVAEEHATALYPAGSFKPMGPQVMHTGASLPDRQELLDGYRSSCDPKVH